MRFHWEEIFRVISTNSTNFYRSKVEILNDQNLFKESNLEDWFSSYVYFYSVGHFSERTAVAQ